MTLVEDKAHLARRADYLAGVADEALREADEAEAAREARRKAEATAAAEIEALTAQLDVLVEARLKAIAAAEVKARELVEAFAGILDGAAEERTVRSRLKVSQIAVHHDGLERRLSGYLSDSLRRLTGPNVPRFGYLGLARHFPMDGPGWVETETFRTGERPVATSEMEKADGEVTGAAGAS